MYLSMDSTNLTNEALREPIGSLAYELASALGDELDEAEDEKIELENEAGDASCLAIDAMSEAIYRLEQIEDRIQDTLDTVPDHQKKGTYADMRDNLKTTLGLIEDAIVYFNAMSESG